MGSETTPPPAMPALATSPRAIFFTDFDGTITQTDSNDFMTDNLGFGTARRKAGNMDALYGRRAFRDCFREMLDSVAATTPFDRCLALLLENIRLDEGFAAFYAWARAENVPVVVLSGGMEPVIRALLGHLLGPEEVKHLQIVSNDVRVRPGKQSVNEVGGWEIMYHDESHFGHDKSLEIRPYANLPADQRPMLFYAGDGVSDLSAAIETDLLFAKAGRDLITYCEKEKVPFTTFESFHDILAVMKDIMEGKVSVKEAATGSS